MPAPLSEDMCQRIIHAVHDLKYSYAKAAKELQTSPATQPELDFLEAQLVQVDTAVTLETLQAHMSTQFGVLYLITSIWHSITQKLQYRLKHMHLMLQNYNDNLCIHTCCAWCTQFLQEGLSLMDCVYVDESGFNLHQICMLKYACKGQHAIQHMGMCNKVIIMDNCRLHYNVSVHAAIGAAGHQLHFLPAYSPFLNAAEWVFAHIKPQMHKNRFNTWEYMVMRMQGEIKRITPEKTSGWIREEQHEQDLANDDRDDDNECGGFDAPVPDYILRSKYYDRSVCLDALNVFARDHGFQLTIRTSSTHVAYLTCRRGRRPPKSRATTSATSSHTSYTACQYSIKLVSPVSKVGPAPLDIQLVHASHNHRPFPDNFEPITSRSNKRRQPQAHSHSDAALLDPRAHKRTRSTLTSPSNQMAWPAAYQHGLAPSLSLGPSAPSATSSLLACTEPSVSVACSSPSSTSTATATARHERGRLATRPSSRRRRAASPGAASSTTSMGSNATAVHTLMALRLGSSAVSNPASIAANTNANATAAQPTANPTLPPPPKLSFASTSSSSASTAARPHDPAGAGASEAVAEPTRSERCMRDASVQTDTPPRAQTLHLWLQDAPDATDMVSAVVPLSSDQIECALRNIEALRLALQVRKACL
ncbi:hypothetical protein [Sporisorium scitamineum]|uniref:Tc1-like transposase DDE domain-containing protein n=1 Tax=Sporisorium scitamineum TaxID=49012 RepID=A0A0F7S7H0_9BASI|nr:hypothetical protein [Sporisorium scitamineum]